MSFDGEIDGLDGVTRLMVILTNGERLCVTWAAADVADV